MSDYPNLEAAKIPIYHKPCDHVKWEDVHSYLRSSGLTDAFSKAYGIQTQIEQGPFAHDVEWALGRARRVWKAK